MMGGVAFQKGLGVTHSLAHALSTVCDLHHGLANGICIPYAMAFNADAVPERMAELAQVVGAKPLERGRLRHLADRAEGSASASRATLADVGVRMRSGSRGWWRSPSPTAATRTTPSRSPTRTSGRCSSRPSPAPFTAGNDLGELVRLGRQLPEVVEDIWFRTPA